MLLSAVSVLVVAQSSSEIPDGLTNKPVCYKMVHGPYNIKLTYYVCFLKNLCILTDQKIV